MGYAKKAKAILEEAYQKDPAALDAGAPTSLGVLYYRVPGLPLRLRRQRQGAPAAGTGRVARAERHGRQLFLCRFPDVQHEYAAAYKVLKHALSLPPQQNRPAVGQELSRRDQELMAKAQASDSISATAADHRSTLFGRASARNCAIHRGSGAGWPEA